MNHEWILNVDILKRTPFQLNFCHTCRPFPYQITFIQPGYAFIKYDSEHDAEKAMSKEKERNMGGYVINIGKSYIFIVIQIRYLTFCNIEWSKSSTKYDPE